VYRNRICKTCWVQRFPAPKGQVWQYRRWDGKD
jgi:hypothetical protein